MNREDIVKKLEDIAQHGGSIAELNACKALLALPEFSDGEERSDPFAALDGGDVVEFRQRKPA